MEPGSLVGRGFVCIHTVQYVIVFYVWLARCSSLFSAVVRDIRSGALLLSVSKPSRAFSSPKVEHVRKADDGMSMPRSSRIHPVVSTAGEKAELVVGHYF